MSASNANRPIPLAASSRATIAHLDAEALSLEASAVRAAQAHAIIAQTSTFGSAKAETLEAQLSAVGVVQARQATLRNVGAGLVQARQLAASGSWLNFVQGVEVSLHGRTLVGLLMARRVSGDVRVLIDWRGAAILGLMLGLVITWISRKQFPSPQVNR